MSAAHEREISETLPMANRALPQPSADQSNQASVSLESRFQGDNAFLDFQQPPEIVEEPLDGTDDQVRPTSTASMTWWLKGLL